MPLTTLLAVSLAALRPKMACRSCKATPIVLDIPFSQISNFVFHCHILEHDDSGMMARIRVLAGREELEARLA